MLNSKIKIKNLEVGNIFLAPMAGYTNAPFRAMCEKLGADLTFTEMVSCKGLCYGSQGTKELLLTYESNLPKAVQIFGSENEYIERAVLSLDLQKFDIIDINMGCPMKKIYNNGEGSALMNDFKKAESIVKSCKKSGKIVSCKIRIGLSQDNIIGQDFAKCLEEAGADFLVVHGRTKDKIYSGEVNKEEIAKIKQNAKIPIIANGGIFSVQDAENLLNYTKCDGVAIARCALENPFIFAEIKCIKNYDKKAIVLEQFYNTKRDLGERFCLVYMRKMCAFYIKGQRDAIKLKTELLSCKNLNELEKMILTIPI